MLYEVTFTGLFAGQVCINRFNYVRTGTTAAVMGSFALSRALGIIPEGTPASLPNNTLFSAWRALVSTSFAFQRVEVRAAGNYDVTDFYERPFVPSVAGTFSGEQNAPFVAFGFKTNRVRLDIGRGYKRFAGVSEGASGPAGNLTADALAAANTLAVRMSQTLMYIDEGNTVSFVPAVVKKRKTVDSATGRTAYVYYPTLEEQMQNVALGVVWETYPTVRHQTSRQYGRGV